MSNQLANNFLEQLLKKEIDFDTDVFKICLMNAGFVFNRATHGTYADISASELPTAVGYTTGGATLPSIVVAQDDTLKGSTVTWGSVQWTATGGSVSASGAVIYDDTHASKFLVGYIDFYGVQTTADGGVATITSPSIQLAG